MLPLAPCSVGMASQSESKSDWGRAVSLGRASG
jgi:hypothetical protein